MMPIAAVPAADAPSGWTTLAGFDLLRLEGPQARHFLHGQATCDLKAAAPERLVGGACCTPKGRVVANFTLFCAAADAQTTLHLRMRATMLEALENFLTTYARFSRTQLAPLGADWRGLGVSGEALETLAKNSDRASARARRHRRQRRLHAAAAGFIATGMLGADASHRGAGGEAEIRKRAAGRR